VLCCCIFILILTFKISVMKKLSIFILVMTLMAGFATAQTINITGTVRTADGDALHFAFVQDKQYKYATYTDSLGNFALAVNPSSKLRVRCGGFRDTLIDINNKTEFSIILKPVVNITAARSNIPAPVDENDDINIATMRDENMLKEPLVPVTVIGDRPLIKNFGTAQLPRLVEIGDQKVAGVVGGPDLAQGAILPQFTHKEATKGSRYLFDTWVHGYVVNNKDSIIQNPGLFFDYDKMGGNLLLTKDKHSAVEVYRERVKSFTLYDHANQAYTFTMVPNIDKTHFVEVIAEGNNYKIYKATQTKFVPSNYSSDGIASSGNRYDEFVDEDTYYVIGKNGIPQKIALKKKALKVVFTDDQVKLNQFFATNDGDIDDNYLHDLGEYMNK